MRPLRTLFAAFLAIALLVAQGHVVAHVYAHEFSAAAGLRDKGVSHAEYCKTCDLAAQFAHALVGHAKAVVPPGAPACTFLQASLDFRPALVLAFSSRAPPARA